MNTIYTAGYSSLNHPSQLLAAAERFNAIVIDIRIKPSSRNPRWRQSFMQKTLGDRYMHVGTYGNVNYKSGPIKLADPDAAATQLTPLLADHSLILLCMCDAPTRCHRTPAAEHLRTITGVVIQHLTTAEIVGRQVRMF